MQLSTAGRTIETLRVALGYSALGERFVELRDPTPLHEPHLAAISHETAELLGLDAAQTARPEFLKLASGSARFAHVPSFATVYAGHQFGSWVKQLGDGRAIALGEVENVRGERYEWQVKGAGMTAFSRFGDGRAVLRSTIREFLCSEAMHALGIPTTRALSIAASDDAVYRESAETAAVLSRVAPSHLRFGHFEFFAARGESDAVKTLADYAIARFYGDLAAIDDDGERYAAFFDAIVERTARLMSQWQAVGFAHGVMNTDNMSVLGLTLDYGPFGFLDAYDPGFICNHTDVTGRYAFAMQPGVGRWNCRALSVALASLVSEERRDAALQRYEVIYRDAQLAALRAKAGLREARDGDAELFSGLLALLAKDRVDYTRFFRALSSLRATSSHHDDAVAAFFGDRAAWYAWQNDYRARLAREATPAFGDAEREAAMKAVNPKYVLRNYLAQRAIEAAEKRDYSELHRLQAILARPFDEQPENERYADAPPDWAAHIEVSCSS